jgi:sugar lactone lactonase YvrE
LAFDSSGDLLFADTNNMVIRKVNAGTGIISTFAGTPVTSGSSGDGDPATSAQLSSPAGVAVDSAGNVFISDTGNSLIRKVNAATGIISTVAGGAPRGNSGYAGDEGPATSAVLSSPQGITVDAAGNVFIADLGNNVIRKVEAATGNISTVAGNGTSGYAGDEGPATSAMLQYPTGVAVDAAGNVFIADLNNLVIRKVNATTGIISTFVGNGSPGYLKGVGAGTSAELKHPIALVLDSVGDMFISDMLDNVIRAVYGVG